MSGKWGEISKTLKERYVDIRCLQKVRWKGQETKRIGNRLNFFGVEIVRQKTVCV